uniref:Reverse transcriptase domain-containing protein n=1 Tax=Tanacetum cinerariifolium TaxID=118510 RepID=A0A6L2K9N0_TANCI|nr:reverse transcriptase domain-containing protein [Tanacetum cinerariifolium]
MGYANLVSHVQLYIEIFQAAAKTERWAMPTWCHMFNSTLTRNARVWFDDLPTKSIDSYDHLKKAFLKNYLQQKKYIKDPIELHNIKQRDGESTEEFLRRYKLESRDVKGAAECMRIFGFLYEITKPELIKRLHDKIPKTVDEMMRVTTSFLRGEVAASSHEWKKSFPPWKQQEGNQKQNFKKGGFRNQQRPKKKQDRFTLLTKTPKEIFALEKGKFKAPPPMTTPVEKRNHTKFYEFYGEVGHNTDEYDLDIKSLTEDEIVRDIEKTLKTLREINMKLNPKKCTFGVEEGMFLGYKVSTKGMKVCPDKVDVVLSLSSPKCLKDVQKLNGKLASLNSGRGIQTNETANSRASHANRTNGKRGAYRLFGGNQRNGKGGPDDRKRSKSNAHLLRQQGIKRSRNKLCINVKVLSRSKVAVRLEKWSIEFGEYAIHYRPRVSVKGQILADFIVERLEEDSPDTLMEVEEELSEPWILFIDGSSCTDGSEARLILTNPEGTEFTYALRFRFDATNNESEYEALIAELRIAKEMGVKNLQANVDS